MKLLFTIPHYPLSIPKTKVQNTPLQNNQSLVEKRIKLSKIFGGVPQTKTHKKTK